MPIININELIKRNYPQLYQGKGLKNRLIFNICKYLFDESSINSLLSKIGAEKDLNFIDSLFDKLNFKYEVSAEDKKRIPAEGPLIMVANHPHGILDGLVLIKLIKEIRNDVKVVANQIFSNISNIDSFILPINFDTIEEGKSKFLQIEDSLKKDQAVIIFPSVYVSRYILGKIRDLPWDPMAVKLAKKYNSPILPINIKGKNSRFYYFVSRFNKDISQFLLFKEVLKKKNGSMSLKIGKLIPSDRFSGKKVNHDEETQLLRKHVQQIGRNKGEIYKTVNTIIHPIGKELLKQDINKAERLGKTKDKKSIFLVEMSSSPNILEEIARLREITFRKVGEGTGKIKDLDDYDSYYKHIVVWDDENLEIVGSYRLGFCGEIIKNQGMNSIYNTEQFIFNDSFKPILEKGVEVGRSFVQMKYWGTYALDYLWQGIGSFLSKYPEYEYLFGAVSISDTYPKDAKNMLIYYHKKWFSDDRNLVSAKNPYYFNQKSIDSVAHLFSSDDVKEDFKNLKNSMRQFGMSIPTLIRRYVDLTEHGGTKFIDYGVDEGFGNSIDCFIVVDLKMIKEDFKKRYYN